MSSSISYPTHVAALKPYVPGLPIAAVAARSGIAQDRIVKLASNENPLGASPRALAALSRAAIDLSRYPDSDCAALSDAIAAFHDVPRDWIVVGAGSESVLGNLVSTLLQPGRSTAYSQYSFQAYVNAAQKLGATFDRGGRRPTSGSTWRAWPTRSSHRRRWSTSPIPAIRPVPWSGRMRSRPSCGRVPAQVVVLLDEAYFEFMPAALRGDSIAWVRRHPNLVVTRTFSKAYGLAGLRIGYGIAQAGLADVMRRVRSPFTISDAAQVAAIAALEDVEFIERTIAMTDQGRTALVHGLRAKGYRCVESHTNFILADVAGGAAFASKLEQHGMIVRPVTSYGLADWVRISIGTPAEIDRFLAAL